jgi:hypothetical protein
MDFDFVNFLSYISVSHQAVYLSVIKQPSGAEFGDSDRTARRPPSGSATSRLSLVIRAPNPFTNGRRGYLNDAEWLSAGAVSRSGRKRV